MRYTSLLIIIGLLPLCTQAQTDSTQEEIAYKDFFSYIDMLQLSMGQNLTVGRYGRGKVPFKDAFASTYHFKQLNLNIKYSRLVKKNLGWSVGIDFFKNVFDDDQFETSYLESTGDSASIGSFDYEHISVFLGINYMFSPLKNLQLATDIGCGLVYSNSFDDEYGTQLDVVDFTPNGISGYRGGFIYQDQKIAPLIYSSLNIRYYLGSEYYIIAGGHFTYSSMKISITERVNFRDERHYKNSAIPINNISISLGLGTLL